MAPRILLSCGESGAQRYEAAVLAAGGVPVAQYAPESAQGFDALLLCGGGDIAPERFGQENQGSMPPDLRRDAAEFALLSSFLQADKPVLGICRGLQVLNVALGGTLRQDLGPLVPFHAQDPEEEKDKIHPIQAKPHSLLYHWYGAIFPVNSSHHQAVDRPGDGLMITARSESGVAEGAELPGRPVLGLQFHPERMTGSCARPDTVDGGAIFQWLIQQCGKTT